MSQLTNPTRIQLPKAWPTCVRSAILHVVSLAQYAAVYCSGPPSFNRRFGPFRGEVERKRKR